MPALRIHTGCYRGSHFSLPLERKIVLGNDVTVDLPLFDVKVAPKQLAIHVTGAGARVTAMTSAVETLVNDTPIRGQTALSHGDRIQVGETTIEFLQSFEESNGDAPDSLLLPSDQLDHRLHVDRELAGRYRILKKIGRSSFEVVYLAIDKEERTQVAIRVLKAFHTRKMRVLRRFLTRAAYGLSIDHRNMLGVRDFGRDRGILYTVTEFVPWVTVSDLLEAGGVFGLKDALYILLQVVDAHLYAQSRNFLLGWPLTERLPIDPDFYVRFSNFWLTTSLEQEVLKTIPKERFPELDQVDMPLDDTSTVMTHREAHYLYGGFNRRDKVPEKEDLVLPLGVFLYQLMTGQNPDLEDSDEVKLKKILTFQTFTLKTVPQKARTLILNSLASRAEDRFETPEAMKQEIQSAYLDVL